MRLTTTRTIHAAPAELTVRRLMEFLEEVADPMARVTVRVSPPDRPGVDTGEVTIEVIDSTVVNPR